MTNTENRSPDISKSFFTRHSVLAAIAGLVVLGAILRYQFFKVSTTFLPTNTDEALNMLMARDIAQGQLPLLFWTQPYQFPLEAYFLALFVNWLPIDAFGARVVLALISSFSLIGFALVFALSGRLKNYWSGLLLVCIPSTYFILRQTAYLIPQYTATITFAWLLPVLFILNRRNPHWLWLALLGFFSGLALSVHLLSLPIVAMIALATCLGVNRRDALRSSLIYLPTTLLGLIPYLAVMFMPDAYSKVTETVPLSDIPSRLWDPILNKILTVTLGINPGIFPDLDFRHGPFSAWIYPTLYFFIICLALALVIRTFQFFRRSITGEWPALGLEDIFSGAIFLTLLAAASAGFGVKYRYILPVTWYFPFLLTYIYGLLSWRLWRLGLGLVALGLTYINYYNFSDIKCRWSSREFTYGIPQMPRLTPLFNYFEKQGIDHCYASWWLVYRINYESNGKVICTQPYNERFPGWPLTPVHEKIERYQDTPVVSLRSDNTRFNASYFSTQLRHNFISANVTKLNHFTIFSDFKHAQSDELEAVAHTDFEITSNTDQRHIKELVDGQLHTIWQRDYSQERPHLRISFKEPTRLALLRLFVPAKDFDRLSPNLKISYQKDNTWQALHRNVEGVYVRLKIDAPTNHIDYKTIKLTFGLPVTELQELKIEMAHGHRKKPWEIYELELFAAH